MGVRPSTTILTPYSQIHLERALQTHWWDAYTYCWYCGINWLLLNESHYKERGEQQTRYRSTISYILGIQTWVVHARWACKGQQFELRRSASHAGWPQPSDVHEGPQQQLAFHSETIVPNGSAESDKKQSSWIMLCMWPNNEHVKQEAMTHTCRKAKSSRATNMCLNDQKKKTNACSTHMIPDKYLQGKPHPTSRISCGAVPCNWRSSTNPIH